MDVAVELGEKKKRAANRLDRSHSSAIVAATVLFPVPAASRSQKTGFRLVVSLAHCLMISNISCRVPCSHSSKSRPYERCRKDSTVPSMSPQRWVLREYNERTIYLLDR
jgi:hypothetical protein